MISGQWFQRKRCLLRIGQNIHKITNYSIKNKGGAHDSKNLGRGPPKKHPHKI